MENNPSRERDIVYCHQCNNEWYRDEHGIICPECQGEFTEIIENGRDPRQEEQHIPGDVMDHDHFSAPDPDEDDIDNVRLEQTGPETYRLRGTYRTTIGRQPGQQQGQQGQAGMGGGLMGIVGNILQGMVGPQQQGQQQGLQPGPNGPGRPASAPGSPPPNGARSPGGTYVRHGSGPGFSYTIATSSNAGNFGGGQFGGMGGPNLFPRNANGPQPYQGQPDHIEQMLNQMMMNIGVMPGQQMGGMRMGPDGTPRGMPHPFHNTDPFGPGPNGPFIIAGGPGMQGPFAQLLNMFGPPGGMAGDAVYSQEALDRIITQLMEQHQAGNAPPPASDEAIKALPKRPITLKDQGDSGKAECSICMDEVPLGDQVTELPCHHWFHFECIKAWLSEHDTCPHCRQGITPRDADAAAQQPRSPHQAPLHDMRSPEYTRPAGAVPGAFPFPRRGSFPGQEGGGEERRRNSEGGDRRGVFSRMRDAFSGGSSSGGNKNSGGGNRDGGGGSGGASGS